MLLFQVSSDEKKAKSLRVLSLRKSNVFEKGTENQKGHDDISTRGNDVEPGTEANSVLRGCEGELEWGIDCKL